MALKLRITRGGNQSMAAASEHEFSEVGGAIGRAPGNDWCLTDNDRVISNTHAFIQYKNGEFYFCDNSTNGSLLNNVQLAKGDERPLKNGDFLKIGPYDIAVEYEAGFAVDVSPNPAPLIPTPTPAVPDVSLGVGTGPGETLDPLELLGAGGGSATVDLPPPDFDFANQDAQPDHSGPESMGYKAPNVIPDPNPALRVDTGSQGIPENWDETGFMPSSTAEPEIPPPAAPTPSPLPPVQPDASPTATVAQPIPPIQAQIPPQQGGSSPDDQNSLAVLLEAAGIPPESATSETYAMLGQIMHVVVQGTVDVLRARAQIKDQFRVPATMLKPVENNPLKFSINAQDALQNLFTKNNPGYQTPVDAFVESFEDIKAHQLAMIAGMRAAYESMLEYFNPDDLAAEFDRSLKRSVLGSVLNKTKYWELYEDLYKSTAGDADASFHKLFGDEFARAYEDQMQRLLTVRKN